MPASRSLPLAALLLLGVLVVSCGALPLDWPPVEPGWRRIVVEVRNDSGRPAVLLVARDLGSPGPVVGRVSPNTVPALTTLDVTIDLPLTDDWAIFVNPGPDHGPLVVAGDVPSDARGKAPFWISVNANGDPGAAVPGNVRGWFGQ